MHQYCFINCDECITYYYYKMLTVGKLGVKYVGMPCTSQRCCTSKTVLKYKVLFVFLIKRRERDVIKIFYKDLLENMPGEAGFLQSNNGRKYNLKRKQYTELAINHARGGTESKGQG